MPAPSHALVTLSPAFTPALVRGMRINPETPLQFEFIMDAGDSGLKEADLKDESAKIIRYFLASLTLPEDDLWVNLSPYEKDRIVPDLLGATEMGRDMLAQDYLLKQITASLTDPDSTLGKEFWSRVYKASFDQYGTTDLPVDTFNKVWIMPDKAEVYVKDDKAFIVDSRLKVMLESDYLAMASVGAGLVSAHEKAAIKPDTNELSKGIIRSVMLPALEKEVNEGRNFAPLRQIYHALILAYWYKTSLKASIVNQVYADQNKVKGIDLSGKADTQTIYSRYVDTFKKGVVNMVREEYDPYTQETIPRKYFSGGEILKLRDTYKTTSNDAAMSGFFSKILELQLVRFTLNMFTSRSKDPALSGDFSEGTTRSSNAKGPRGISRRDFLGKLAIAGAIIAGATLMPKLLERPEKIKPYRIDKEYLYSLSKKDGIKYLEGFYKAVRNNTLAPDAAIKFMKEILDTEPLLWMRRAAVRSLVSLEAFTADEIKDLIENTPDINVLEGIAQGLGDAKLDQHVNIIIAWSKKDITNPFIRRAIVKGLGIAATPDAVKCLIEWRSITNDYNDHDLTAHALGQAATPEAIQHLMMWSKTTKDTILLGTILYGLGIAATPEAVEYLKKFRETASGKTVISHVFNGLGRAATQDAVAYMITQSEYETDTLILDSIIEGFGSWF